MRKKILKAITGMVVFCILFGVTGKLARYLVTDDTTSYTRITYHEMYEQDNIDVLFVGSSHCYRSFKPEILDEELGLNTFNVGSSSQLIDGSYLLIKEAARYNDIKHIYLEVYFDVARDVKANRTDPTAAYIIADYLRPSVDKYLYLLNATTSEYYGNSFFVARRNWENLFDFDSIKTLLQKKSTDSYKEYKYDNVTFETEWYGGKGFVDDSHAVNNWNIFSYLGWPEFSVDSISQDWVDEMNKIMDYCEKEDIALTLVAAPMPNYLLVGGGNYDEYVSFVNDLIKDRDVDYLDFNLCKEEYFPNDCTLFRDENHLNGAGAEVFSHLFADVVNGKLDMDDITYDTYQEKIDNIDPMVFGLAYYDHIEPDGTFTSRDCKIVTNSNDELEFRITYEPDGGEAYLLRDYSSDIVFQIPPQTTGDCIIEYRYCGEDDIIGRVDVTIT